jgi:hypothetical protein
VLSSMEIHREMLFVGTYGENPKNYSTIALM